MDEVNVMGISKIETVNTLSQNNKNLRTAENLDKSEKVSADIIKAQQKIDNKEVMSAVDKANTVLFKNNTHLQFRVHEKTNEVMVKIVDDVSGEVLKEIPPEKMLDLVAKLWEIAGIIVDEKA